MALPSIRVRARILYSRHSVRVWDPAQAVVPLPVFVLVLDLLLGLLGQPLRFEKLQHQLGADPERAVARAAAAAGRGAATAAPRGRRMRAHARAAK
eukprot:6186300-Pleurochrysis_carterae.AAC.1